MRRGMLEPEEQSARIGFLICQLPVVPPIGDGGSGEEIEDATAERPWHPCRTAEEVDSRRGRRDGWRANTCMRSGQRI